jgi:hypothetical protein
MLNELSGAALVELERALRGRLAEPPETPAQRRAGRLGFLAELIRETGLGRPPRITYDQGRPASAPSGQELVDEFGSWRKACRAAAGVLPDGRIHRPGQSNHPRTPSSRVKTDGYTGDEIVKAIRRCAHAEGRKPTSLAYERWRDRKLGQAKRHGKTRPRIPALPTISRAFGRWEHALGSRCNRRTRA